MSDLTYSYDIDLIGIYYELNGKQNVVYELRTHILSTDQQSNTHSRLLVTPIPTNDLTDFIEYKDLTREKVIEWIEKYSSSTIESIKKDLHAAHYPTTAYLKPEFK